MDNNNSSNNNINNFDFGISVPETQWVVHNLIPKGHLCFMLAQAGVGKSLLLESLAIHIIHGIDFAGLKTVAGDSVINRPGHTLRCTI
jgi:RecA-family ATPase